MKLLKLIFGLILIAQVISSCNDDDNEVSSVPANDPVYNDSGGFVITYGMLEKRYNEITFPGTHNSYAGIGINWILLLCKNQGLTIAQQLANGIRYIEFDIDFNLYVTHGGLCIGYLNERLQQIKQYVQANPQQIITVRISDLYAFSPDTAYREVNKRLRDLGIDQYIFNWDATKSDHDPLKCYIPDPWPTLGEMIASGKTIMFFHHRDYDNHGVFDEGVSPGLSYSDTDLHYFYEAPQLEQLSKSMPVWAPPRYRQQEGPNRLFLIEVYPDGNVPAGDRGAASRNNDGRKLYQLAKQHENEILPDGRVVNFINVDFFMSSLVGELPIDVVDASNRLNFERFGMDWQNSAYFWESYPYEFDDTKIELISQIPAIRAEVDEVIADFKNKINLAGHENKGMIVSTHNAIVYDWRRLPEWAVDGDLFTRWASATSSPNHTWGIDLGASKPFNEIAIAWEFPNKAPAYTFYVSNDDDRFADGISNDELLYDDGWLPAVVQLTARSNIDPLEPWDRRTFDLNSLGLGGARYLKIKVTDTDELNWPNFYEVRIYQSFIQVSIDIKPGSYPNSINLGSHGVTPVAIFSTDTFDATTIDPATVTLAGATVKIPGKSGKYLCHEKDINDDQLADLVCKVLTAELNLEQGDTIAVLEAKTLDGVFVRGEDTVRIVPGAKRIKGDVANIF